MAFLLAVLAMAFTAGPAFAIDVLYITNDIVDGAPTDPGDPLTFGFFIGRGDVVTLMDSGEPAAAKLAASEAADLTYISEHIGSSSVGNQLNSSSKPVVTGETFLLDDWLITSNQANTDLLTDVDVIGSGPVTVFDAPSNIGSATPDVNPFSARATMVGDPTLYTDFTVPAGATLNDGSTNAGDRAFVGSATGLNVGSDPTWTAAGEALFSAAVNSVLPSRVNGPGMVVGYDFREGSGTTVGDQSGNGTPLDLTIHDAAAVSWGNNGTISFDSAAIVSSASAPNVAPESTAGKLFDAITATEEITIEAWVKPDNIVENAGPARVVTMSTDPTNRNFTQGQDSEHWQTRLRTTDAGNNGSNVRLETDGEVATKMQHLVYTRDSSGEAKIYVDGAEAPLSQDNAITGDMSNWDPTYDFALGNELTWGDIAQRDFLGDMALVAVFDRPLSADEVAQNFQAGPYQAVPEPTSLLLCLLGVIGICGLRRRRSA